MKMSDAIAQYIINLLNEQNGTAEIKRNSLANNLGCVPSQINYVITSRFTPENGYIVESRRGGGGFVRIVRVTKPGNEAILEIINSIGSTIDKATCEHLLESLVDRDIVPFNIVKIMVAALSDRALVHIEQDSRAIIRADLLKNMLICFI